MPEILPGRCTHARSPRASCNNCVEICPRAALRIGEDRCLILDSSSCDECGLCVVCCPEGALASRLSEPLSDGAYKFLACEVATGKDGEGILPCLHAASEQMLANLARQGIRLIKVAHGDCASCVRYSHIPETLEQRLSIFNIALQSRGLPVIAIERVDVTVWQKHADLLRETASRRGFFGSLFHRPAATLLLSGSIDESVNEASAAGILLHEHGAGPLPWVPVVDFSRCTLCGACTSLCAHQALEIHAVEKVGIFSIAPAQCTGCKLCKDVCRDDAIAINKWTEPAATQVTSLVKQICNRCRHPFWQLAESEEIAVCCPVCRQSGGKVPNRLVED